MQEPWHTAFLAGTHAHAVAMPRRKGPQATEAVRATHGEKAANMLHDADNHPPDGDAAAAKGLLASVPLLPLRCYLLAPFAFHTVMSLTVPRHRSA